jgi:hypothetical protein
MKDLNRNGRFSAPVFPAAPPVRRSRLRDREYGAVCGPAHDRQGNRNLRRWNVLPCACRSGSVAHFVRPRYQPDAAACKTYVPAFSRPVRIHMKSLAPPVSELLPERPHARSYANWMPRFRRTKRHHFEERRYQTVVNNKIGARIKVSVNLKEGAYRHQRVRA